MNEQAEQMQEQPKPFPWLIIAGVIIGLAVLAGGGVVVAGALTDAQRRKRILEIAAERNIPEAVALAIFTIESGGKAFGKDGRMIIRFEPHVFKYETDPRPRLQRTKPYQGQEIAVLRAGQAAEWDNFNRAAAINRDAAMMSISMGMAQVMGFNYQSLGYPSVQAMFDALSTSEDAQIRSFFDFVKANGLENAARTGAWTKFARGYNGAGQQGYDTKMESYYNSFLKKGYKGIA